VIFFSSKKQRMLLTELQLTADVILRSRRRRRICIFLIFMMPGELQIVREVYPERANCRPFAALRVTVNGLRMTGWAVGSASQWQVELKKSQALSGAKDPCSCSYLVGAKETERILRSAQDDRGVGFLHSISRPGPHSAAPRLTGSDGRGDLSLTLMGCCPRLLLSTPFGVCHGRLSF